MLDQLFQAVVHCLFPLLKYMQCTEEDVACAGPLEASISNLKIEIRAKTCKGRELQQRWMTIQGQLVAVQSTHAEAAESIQLMHAERAVLQRKKQRLEQQ